MFNPLLPIFIKARKRIETLLSQLCDQFTIRRNYAKSFQGLKTIISAKNNSINFGAIHQYFF